MKSMEFNQNMQLGTNLTITMEDIKITEGMIQK